LAQKYGETTVIEIAQGISYEALSERVPAPSRIEIVSLYKQVLDVEELSKCEVGELLRALRPDSLLERFAYRKQTGHHNSKDFIKLKGTKGQVNHSEHET
jgi:hypothetical protein